jgi:hypothetical protein
VNDEEKWLAARREYDLAALEVSRLSQQLESAKLRAAKRNEEAQRLRSKLVMGE